MTVAEKRRSSDLDVAADLVEVAEALVVVKCAALHEDIIVTDVGPASSLAVYRRTAEAFAGPGMLPGLLIETGCWVWPSKNGNLSGIEGPAHWNGPSQYVPSNVIPLVVNVAGLPNVV